MSSKMSVIWQSNDTVATCAFAVGTEEMPGRASEESLETSGINRHLSYTILLFRCSFAFFLSGFMVGFQNQAITFLHIASPVD